MENFTQQTLNKFEELLTAQIQVLPNLNPIESQEMIEQIVKIFRDYGSNGSPRVFDLLRDSDIRREWNKVFAEQRSVEIANWITPFCNEIVLDLICGDGKVGKIIERTGKNIANCDRNHWRDFNDFGFIDYNNLKEGVNNHEIETVLLITVLHHQKNPVLLLDQAFGTASKNVVIIENTIDEDCDAKLHSLFDEFANNGLNESGDLTPNNHKTAGEWREILELRGEIIREDYRSSVPGVLLPHQLYVVNQR
jgi:2-polyprenyl-3-methyl-5-hydroxy-6-metoxy-1,4-benzoquinol methylase